MNSRLNPVDAYREVSAGTEVPASEDEVLTRYGPMVRRIAHHLAGRLPQTVEIEDLIQAGLMGLIESARKYEPGQGASFETFAGIRVRGAMIDQVRPCDWAPRSLHRKARALGRAIHAVESRQGREARDAEVMDELSMAADEYYTLLRDINTSKMLSVEAIVPSDGEGTAALSVTERTPQHQQMESEFRSSLVEAIEHLPERERQVLSMYYQDELNLREIGAVLGVTESRVCQIHAKVMARLRAELGDWGEELETAELL
jgi:RNA polymerase sigma factor for flagellar operon FliA